MNEIPCGFLNMNKPKGITSHDVVNRVRRLLKIKKVGHAGTLDPNAAGILLVGVGRATKYIQYLELLDKTYEAELILGVGTDTEDITGKVIAKADSHIDSFQLEKALSHFRGKIHQIPPAYSAIKINGRKCYDYARKGVSVEIPAREVTIFDLSCLDDTGLPNTTILRVHCSKGTYIRSLCRDLGEDMKIPACMGELTRTQIGHYTLEDALSLEELENIVSDDQLDQYLISPDEALAHYKKAVVSERGMRFVPNGGALYSWNSLTSFDDFKEGELIRLMGAEAFIGLGRFIVSDPTGYPAVIPVKLL